MFGNWLRPSLMMAAIVALFGADGALLGGGQEMLLAVGLGSAIAGLFSTYPDTGERIATLRALVRGAGAY